MNPGDATLTFLQGSHQYHAEFRERFGITTKSDWNMIDTPEKHHFYTQERGCVQKSIQCPAGSMVLWDSRTIHSGQEALKQRAQPNIRCVVYICMTPRSMASSKDLEKKRKAFQELRTTNHYPHRPKLFPTTPHTCRMVSCSDDARYGQPLPPVRRIGAPVLNSLGKRLAGFDSI